MLPPWPLAEALFFNSEQSRQPMRRCRRPRGRLIHPAGARRSPSSEGMRTAACDCQIDSRINLASTRLALDAAGCILLDGAWRPRGLAFQLLRDTGHRGPNRRLSGDENIWSCARARRRRGARMAWFRARGSARPEARPDTGRAQGGHAADARAVEILTSSCATRSAIWPSANWYAALRRAGLTRWRYSDWGRARRAAVMPPSRRGAPAAGFSAEELAFLAG